MCSAPRGIHKYVNSITALISSLCLAVLALTSCTPFVVCALLFVEVPTAMSCLPPVSFRAFCEVCQGQWGRLLRMLTVSDGPLSRDQTAFVLIEPLLWDQSVERGSLPQAWGRGKTYIGRLHGRIRSSKLQSQVRMSRVHRQVMSLRKPTGLPTADMHTFL